MFPSSIFKLVDELPASASDPFPSFDILQGRPSTLEFTGLNGLCADPYGLVRLICFATYAGYFVRDRFPYSRSLLFRRRNS